MKSVLSIFVNFNREQNNLNIFGLFIMVVQELTCFLFGFFFLEQNLSPPPKCVQIWFNENIFWYFVGQILDLKILLKINT